MTSRRRHVAEEAEAGDARRSLVDPRDGLDLRMVGRDAVAHEAERRGERSNRSTATPILRRAGVRRVEARGAGADDGDASRAGCAGTKWPRPKRATSGRPGGIGAATVGGSVICRSRSPSKPGSSPGRRGPSLGTGPRPGHELGGTDADIRATGRVRGARTDGERLPRGGIALPTFAQLADPSLIPAAVRAALAAVGPDEPPPLNLFRVHWYNDADRTQPRRGARARRAAARADRRRGADRRRARRPLPDDRRAQGARRLRLPRAARSSPASSTRPRDRAVWPSTGNYCRGGVAISRLHGLPRRRRAARGHEPRALRLARASGSPTRTTSSARRAPRATSRRSTTAATSSTADPANVILNQFCRVREPPRPLPRHRPRARARVRVRCARARPGAAAARRSSRRPARPARSRAGDYLKERYGSLIVAVEALECPTHARERLRRAQHPGDRRQAHPADPQRHEHRRRRSPSPTAPPTGSACCSARERGPRATSPNAAACPTAVLDALAVARALEHLQRARRDQDGQALRPRARRRRSSPSPPTAPRCTAASASSRSRSTSPDGFDEVAAGGGLRRAPARRRRPTTCSS